MICSPFSAIFSLLHARGGVSSYRNTGLSVGSSSPRSWRCFLMSKNAKLWDCVFSTLVEVFLKATKNQIKAQSLLHARGGVSISFVTFCKFAMSSPRSWRCFYSSFLKSQIHQVFSTLVEVFPSTFRPLSL